MAVEKHIAIGADGGRINSFLGEDAVEVARTTAVQRIADDFQFCIAQNREVNQFAQSREIRPARVDHLLAVAFSLACGGWGRRSERCGPRLDILRYFRQCGAAIGGGKFQPVIFRGVVAGGEIDCAVSFLAQDFIGDSGRGSGARAEKYAHAVRAQHVAGQPRKLFGKETGIVADDQDGRLRPAANVLRDGAHRHAHICERELIGDQRAPAGGPEVNRIVERLFPHRGVLYLAGQGRQSAARRGTGNW